MSLIHDNTIKSYSIDFENEMLTIETRYEDSGVHEKTSIVFRGYLMHVFYSEMKGSIIFDIAECPIDIFSKKNYEVLARLREHDCPIISEHIHDLINRPKASRFKVFSISSVLGLYGWVVAEQMEINTNT